MIPPSRPSPKGEGETERDKKETTKEQQ